MIYYFESEIKMPLMNLPLRCTLIKGSNFLILISPVDFDEEQIQKIRAIGEVTDIIAPSLFHHTYIPKAAQLFPKAKLWASPGLEKKRPDVSWSQTISKNSWPYSSEVEIELVSGAPKLNEVVFLEKKSGTLVVTDLCFNIEKPRGFGSFLILSYFGTYKKFAVSTFWKKFVKNENEFCNSLKQILSWDFSRIVMAHGEIIEQDGKALLKQSLAERGYIQ